MWAFEPIQLCITIYNKMSPIKHAYLLLELFLADSYYKLKHLLYRPKYCYRYEIPKFHISHLLPTLFLPQPARYFEEIDVFKCLK